MSTVKAFGTGVLMAVAGAMLVEIGRELIIGATSLSGTTNYIPLVQVFAVLVGIGFATAGVTLWAWILTAAGQSMRNEDERARSKAGTPVDVE